jgi:ABC-type nitrate/sulfonate/bicarbonate transport system permease component
MAGVINTLILPPPSRLFEQSLIMIASGELWQHVSASTLRVLVGFLLAALLGIGMGLLLGMSRPLDRYFGVLIELLRPIPPIAWIPIAILWFGIGNRPAYFIVFLGGFFPVFVNTYKGVHAIHPAHILAAQCLGANRRLLLTDVIIPAALPSIVTGLRVGLGVAWASVIAAELVGAQSGLGYLIQTNRILLRTDKIIVGIFAIGALGFAMNQLMLVLEKRLLVWQE